MLKSQELEKILRKFNDSSPVAMDSRVSVETPDGTMWDIGQIFLAENKIIGVRETHRMVIRLNTEIASPGKVIGKL